MIFNFRSQTQRRQEMDRRQWANYTKVEFPLIVHGDGETVTPVFHFGQAFTRPPEFDWSVLAEQIIEEGPR